MRSSERKSSEKGESTPVSGFANMLYVAEVKSITVRAVQPIAREERLCSLWKMKGQRWMLISIRFVPL